MTRLEWLLGCHLGVLGFVALSVGGCADACTDDGLLQDESSSCPAASGSSSGAETETNTESDSDSDTESAGGGCADGTRNGDETDVDCGGACGATCEDGEGCLVDEDCVSNVCGDDETCRGGSSDTEAEGSCEDGTQNGDETDIDCGGACGPTCEDGEGCDDGDDCVSGQCNDGGTCGGSDTDGGGCEDGTQNGDETDEDCGGSCGPTCEDGEGCEDDNDCVSGVCDPGTMTCLPPAATTGSWLLSNYEGSNTLIDFTQDPPVVTCNGSVGVCGGYEGTATYTRPEDGALLLYSDSISLYNGQTNALITDQMAGNITTTESSAIVPVPGEDAQYFVFTNGTVEAGAGVLAYSVFDLSVGDGAVVSLNNPLPEPPSENPGEALDVIRHANGVDFWLLTYDGADEIVAHRVTSAGPTSPAVRSTLPDVTGMVNRGVIVHDPSGMRLGLGMTAQQRIGAADFDRSTGEVSNVEWVVTDAEVGYSLALSVDGTKMYYANGSDGFDGTPWQYDLSTETAFELSTSGGYAAVALARDGQLWWSSSDDESLATVESPDQAGAAANFVEDALSLDGCSAGFGTMNQGL